MLETVGAATGRLINVLKPGGTLVICGATREQPGQGGTDQIFFKPLRVIGSTMGTRAELISLTGC